jgi:uncharacterized protein YndB with AHSA1/START domain
MKCERTNFNLRMDLMAEMDNQTQEVIITRTIFSPPSRVYAAFTSAEGWVEWCCEQAKTGQNLQPFSGALGGMLWIT